MTNRQTSAVMFGFLGLFLASWFIPSSKTQVLHILADAQAVQEVSPKLFFPKKSLDEDLLVQAQTEFGFKLFSSLAQQDSGQNVFVSPLSITLALSMLYNGANGQTQQEMSTALGIDGVHLEALNRANQTLANSLQSGDEGVQLAVANALWAKQGVPFRYQFLKDNRAYYYAQITNLNFESAESAGIINRWVEDNTQGKISDIIDHVNPQDVLFLINAIYFTGVWPVAFDQKLTTEQPFYISDGSVIDAPFMSGEGKYLYFETSQFQVISLPYEKGRYSLEVFLPKVDSSLEELLPQITATRWKKWIGQLREQEGNLQLPRFNLSYEVDLKKALESLGMSTVFAPSSANFAQLTSHPAYVNSVKHKTLIEVTEKGIKVAPKNSVEVGVTSSLTTDDQFSMVVNRPFICWVRDHKTDTIVFIGRVEQPNSN